MHWQYSSASRRRVLQAFRDWPRLGCSEGSLPISMDIHIDLHNRCTWQVKRAGEDNKPCRSTRPLQCIQSLQHTFLPLNNSSRSVLEPQGQCVSMSRSLHPFREEPIKEHVRGTVSPRLPATLVQSASPPRDSPASQVRAIRYSQYVQRSVPRVGIPCPQHIRQTPLQAFRGVLQSRRQRRLYADGRW